MNCMSNMLQSNQVSFPHGYQLKNNCDSHIMLDFQILDYQPQLVVYCILVCTWAHNYFWSIDPFEVEPIYIFKYYFTYFLFKDIEVWTFMVMRTQD